MRKHFSVRLEFTWNRISLLADHIFENSFIITAQIKGCNLMSVKGVGDSIYAKIYFKSSIVQYRKNFEADI